MTAASSCVDRLPLDTDRSIGSIPDLFLRNFPRKPIGARTEKGQFVTNPCAQTAVYYYIPNLHPASMARHDSFPAIGDVGAVAPFGTFPQFFSPEYYLVIPFNFRRRSLAIAAVISLAAAAFGNSLLFAQVATEYEEEQVIVMDGGAAGEMKTVAVVAASSYGDLISDINFIGSLGQRPELGQMVEGIIGAFTQFKGLAGVDKTKTWGVIVQTDGAQFLPVGCIPVTNLDEVLGLVQGFGLQISDGADGTKVIPTPNGPPIHVKEQNGWAFLATSPASFSQLPADPQATLNELTKDYDLAVQVSVQNVPEMYRQMALGAMKSGMEQGLKRKDDESDEEYELRRQAADTQFEQLERMINEINEVTVGWSVDAEQQQTFFDFIYSFVPGSKMARQIASYGQPKTNFAGFYQPDAAVTFSFASQADPELIKEDLEQMRSAMQTMRKQAENAIDKEEDIPDEATREAIKAALSDFMDAFQATMESGHMDGGAALQLQPDSLTLVAGALVQEPSKFESGLKKIAAVAEKEPDFNGVQWNAANHAGVTFHTLSAPVPADEEEARKFFGEKVEIAFGIGSEAVYLAVGQDNLAAVNRAIDASVAEPNKAVPIFELSASLGQIMATAADNADPDKRAMLQAIADMLQDQAQGRDHIRMTGTLIENGLRNRIVAEEGVLRAVGAAAVEAQKMKQQQRLQ